MNVGTPFFLGLDDYLTYLGLGQEEKRAYWLGGISTTIDRMSLEYPALIHGLKNSLMV